MASSDKARIIAWPPGKKANCCSMAGEGGLKVSELSEQEQLQGEELRRRIRDLLGRSLHIRHVDSGSCNGCDFEMSTLTNPVYDVQRFGIDFVASPRHADMLMVTGGVTRHLEELQKTMDNAWCAVREGGVVIILGECEEGSGSAQYEKMMKDNPSPELVETALRAKFEIGAHKAYAVTRLMKKAEFILVSGMEPDFAKMLLFTPAKDIEAALQLAYAKLGPKPTITLMPMGSITVPLNATPTK